MTNNSLDTTEGIDIALDAINASLQWLRNPDHGVCSIPFQRLTNGLPVNACTMKYPIEEIQEFCHNGIIAYHLGYDTDRKQDPNIFLFHEILGIGQSRREEVYNDETGISFFIAKYGKTGVVDALWLIRDDLMARRQAMVALYQTIHREAVARVTEV